jgi:anti-sigma regulatory factor (Ser/Thr protein kinase)
MQTLALSFPCEPEELSRVRHQLHDWLEAVNVPAEQRPGIVIGTHEAAANAVRHAQPCETFQLRAEIQPTALTIEIVDQGHWAGYSTDHLRTHDAFEEHGRGLDLIQQLFGHVEIRTSQQGTTIQRQPIVL